MSSDTFELEKNEHATFNDRRCGCHLENAVRQLLLRFARLNSDKNGAGKFNNTWTLNMQYPYLNIVVSKVYDIGLWSDRHHILSDRMFDMCLPGRLSNVR